MNKFIIVGIVGIVAVGGYFAYKMIKDKEPKESKAKAIAVPTSISLPKNINTSNVKVTGSAVVSNYIGFDGAINSTFSNY